MSSIVVEQEKRLNEAVRETVVSMQAWPHWTEIAHGAHKEYGISPEDFFLILPEYQRFMALLRGYPGLGMLSEKVDILWHAHLLNTRRYQDFCTSFIGHFVHHLPCSSYDLYGFTPKAEICEEPPATCMDPFPPSDDDDLNPMHAIIRDGAPRFIAAYTAVFGHAPSEELWPRVVLVDAIAQ